VTGSDQNDSDAYVGRPDVFRPVGMGLRVVPRFALTPVARRSAEKPNEHRGNIRLCETARVQLGTPKNIPARMPRFAVSACRSSNAIQGRRKILALLCARIRATRPSGLAAGSALYTIIVVTHILRLLENSSRINLLGSASKYLTYIC
jgi:hypothetical protein